MTTKAHANKSTSCCPSNSNRRRCILQRECERQHLRLLLLLSTLFPSLVASFCPASQNSIQISIVQVNSRLRVCPASPKKRMQSQSISFSSSQLFSSKYVQLQDIPDRLESDRSGIKFRDRESSSTSAKTSQDTSRWLSWMRGGTPRGVADVKMRDPIALGGVPRSDRYASKDWLHNTINLPCSAILRSVQFPVISMTIWGFVISLIHRSLIKRGLTDLAAHMCIPSSPHSLTVSALGLLLVFRTNSAYQRFTVSI